jgi:hypothetical protein
MATTPWIRDGNFVQTKAFPAAAATNYATAFDLGAAADGNDTRLYALEIAIPALANNTDNSKTILLTLQDSADNSSFANVAPLVQIQIPGVTTTGSAAVTYVIYLPPSIRKYVRFSQVVAVGGGDNAASEVTYSLLFH